MHRDHKLALALALLLIGVAAALCFPKQQPAGVADLDLEDSEQLDAAIDLLPVRVYTEPHRRPGEAAAPTADVEPVEPKPELRDPFTEFALLPSAPDPIPLAEVSRPTHDRLPDETTSPSPPIEVEAWPDSGTVGNTVTPPAASVDAPDAPVLYVVQPGDTLSGLAGRFLGSTRRYLDLYEANRDILSSPDDLQVGMRLKIPQVHATEVRVTPASEPGSDSSGGTSRSITGTGSHPAGNLFSPR